MRFARSLASLSALALLLSRGQALAKAENLAALRTAPGTVLVTWTAKGAVDLYVADRPDANPASARLVSRQDRDGQQEVAVDPNARPYFLIADKADGRIAEVAERLVALEQGSNFRDIGGYAGAGGKHVRWGLIYRSGATPLLTEADEARISALGLRNLVDLRSSEERQIAPSKIEGVPYAAVGYSMVPVIERLKTTGNSGALYRDFPKMLAPQLRLLFADLKRNDGPVAYNCSAGQDRTGFATAMILTVLGVPRETILQDYHLSTTYRQPEFELPKIDPAAYPGNEVAQFLAGFQNQPAAKPQPLYDRDGSSLLSSAFAEIEEKYGSVGAYLEREAGVTAADIAKLRADYLE